MALDWTMRLQSYDATLDEYMPVKCIKEAEGDNDVLDEGHLYIVIGS